MKIQVFELEKKKKKTYCQPGREKSELEIAAVKPRPS
jgi:hypothetical protein